MEDRPRSLAVSVTCLVSRLCERQAYRLLPSKSVLLRDREVDSDHGQSGGRAYGLHAAPHSVRVITVSRRRIRVKLLVIWLLPKQSFGEIKRSDEAARKREAQKMCRPGRDTHRQWCW